MSTNRKQTIQRIKWCRTPYKNKYPYRSQDLLRLSTCHSSAHFFLSPGIFLLGVPVIFSPFSTVLIFASLYQNKEEREKLQDKGGPASPQVSSLIHKKRHRQLFLQYLPHPRIIVNNPVFPTKEIKLTRKRGLFLLTRIAKSFWRKGQKKKQRSKLYFFWTPPSEDHCK